MMYVLYKSALIYWTAWICESAWMCTCGKKKIFIRDLANDPFQLYFLPSVSRLHCESESFKMDLILDVNIQIYPVDLGKVLNFPLVQLQQIC